jgi:hypothetical protein
MISIFLMLYSMSNILIVIPGLGEPYLQHKLNILHNNIKIIDNTINGNLTLMIFNYSLTNNNYNFNTNNKLCVIEHKKKTYLGQAIFNYVQPQLIDSFDYILMILDDIELNSSFDLQRMIYSYNKYKFDILSPVLTLDSQYSHLQMLEDTSPINSIRTSTFIELFCYLMDPCVYKKYYQFYDENSKFCWGIDLLLYEYKFKLGLINDVLMKHHYKGISYENINPYEEMRNVFIKFGFPINTKSNVEIVEYM